MKQKKTVFLLRRNIKEGVLGGKKWKQDIKVLLQSTFLIYSTETECV